MQALTGMLPGQACPASSQSRNSNPVASAFASPAPARKTMVMSRCDLQGLHKQFYSGLNSQQVEGVNRALHFANAELAACSSPAEVG